MAAQEASDTDPTVCWVFVCVFDWVNKRVKKKNRNRTNENIFIQNFPILLECLNCNEKSTSTSTTLCLIRFRLQHDIKSIHIKFHITNTDATARMNFDIFSQHRNCVSRFHSILPICFWVSPSLSLILLWVRSIRKRINDIIFISKQSYRTKSRLSLACAHAHSHVCNPNDFYLVLNLNLNVR